MPQDYKSTQGREHALPYARFIIICALYHSSIKAFEAQGNDLTPANKQTAFDNAVKTAEYIEKLNNSSDRIYHLSSHGFVQLLDEQARDWLDNIADADNHQKLGVACNDFDYELGTGPDRLEYQDIEAFLHQVSNTTSAEKIEETMQHVVGGAIHDSIYYLPSRNNGERPETDQHKLMSDIRSNVVTVDSLVAHGAVREGDITFNPQKVILKAPDIRHKPITLGELAAVCFFPSIDLSGNTNTNVNLVGRNFKGLNEYVSAIVGIDAINSMRKQAAIPPLNLEETLVYMMQVAMTVPFYQYNNLLEKAAKNLYHFIMNNPQVQGQLGLTGAHGVIREFRNGDNIVIVTELEKNVASFVDNIMYKAAQLSIADVKQFVSTMHDLEEGDIAVAKESMTHEQQQQLEQNDPVTNLHFHLKMFKKHTGNELDDYVSPLNEPRDLKEHKIRRRSATLTSKTYNFGLPPSFIPHNFLSNKVFVNYEPLWDETKAVDSSDLNRIYIGSETADRGIDSFGLADKRAIQSIYRAALNAERVLSELSGGDVLAPNFEITNIDEPTNDDIRNMQLYATSMFSSTTWNMYKDFIQNDQSQTLVQLKARFNELGINVHGYQPANIVMGNHVETGLVNF